MSWLLGGGGAGERRRGCLGVWVLVMMYFVIWVEMTCTVSWVLLPSKLYTRETLADPGICVSRDLASDCSLRRVSPG